MAKQYALVFDLHRCIGCHTCVMACKVENGIDEPQTCFMKVFTNTGLLADIPSGKYPDLSLSWQPRTCMQCKNPPCVKSCPEEAIYWRPDGIVLIDEEKCTGCQICLDECPYDAIELNPGTKRAAKCSLCSQRVDQGLEPLCVKECIFGAIQFGDTADPKSKVSRLIATRKGYTLKPELGSEPSNYYLSP